MYDAVIIGSGPAGLSCALNLKLHEKDFVWFGAKGMSRKVELSEKIANYPGFDKISGQELNAHFQAQAKEMGLEIRDQMVTLISQAGDHFMLLVDNDMIETRTLLLATGVAQTKGFEGEEALLGRGVSYCATCDGFLYKGKTIGVYVQDQRFMHELLYLAELAEKVYFYKGFREEAGELPENVELLDKPIKEVLGEGRVSGLRLSDGREVSLEGLFCLRNALAPTTLMPGLALEGPHIAVNRQMQTNFSGCYAAGDCTGRPYQITKAVGEGNIAAHEILSYLAEKEA